MRPKPSFVLRTILAALLAVAPALVPRASAAPQYKVLHSFTGGRDGGGLWGSLTLDGKGNVYGTTTGTVLRLTPKAGGKWNLTTLHRFHYPGKGGSSLTGSVIFDAAGNLYSTGQVGGAN
jgi:hypothetical protein